MGKVQAHNSTNLEPLRAALCHRQFHRVTMLQKFTAIQFRAWDFSLIELYNRHLSVTYTPLDDAGTSPVSRSQPALS